MTGHGAGQYDRRQGQGVCLLWLTLRLAGGWWAFGWFGLVLFCLVWVVDQVYLEAPGPGSQTWGLPVGLQSDNDDMHG
jgi:hypothetical protein